jgi:hypothetical protein
MPLHRDIHWIGRQWAVTGHGMQLIDQKLQGFFDIEIARLWDDDLVKAMHAKEWLNAVDFDKGLAVARERFKQPLAEMTPVQEVVSPPAVEPPAPPPPLQPVPKRDVPETIAPKAIAPALKKSAPVEPPSATATSKAQATVTPPPAKLPATVAPPRQVAPLPAIDPPPVQQDAKRDEPKLQVSKTPKPLTVTVTRRKPVTPATAAAPPPRAPIPAPDAVAPPSSLPPPVKREEPKLASAEQPRRTLRMDASPIRARVEPPDPPSLFRMRYQGHARFVRPWRVVSKQKT